jgi:hypothetical protein
LKVPGALHDFVVFNLMLVFETMGRDDVPDSFALGRFWHAGGWPRWNAFGSLLLGRDLTKDRRLNGIDVILDVITISVSLRVAVEVHKVNCPQNVDWDW